jgi:K+-transporting ATPase ATPase B chain
VAQSGDVRRLHRLDPDDTGSDSGLSGPGQESTAFILGVAIWLWFTVLFANFRGGSGRRTQQGAGCIAARPQEGNLGKAAARPRADAEWHTVPADDLRVGNVVLVTAGETVPADGEVIEGVASVDESAITGESAPVIRESGGDFSAVTGGTRVLSDWLVVRVTVNPGETFVDRMIAMVETAKRQKTPNEIALAILLAALTIVFLGVTATLLPFSEFSVTVAGSGSPVSITVLIALLVCLIPTTIAGLLSAVGVAGMSRMMQANVIATSGRAVEAAGDVDVLLLDKTGTITLGNRQAAAFLPAEGSARQNSPTPRNWRRSPTKRRRDAASSSSPSSASTCASAMCTRSKHSSCISRRRPG